jgi:hypothetical protein
MSSTKGIQHSGMISSSRSALLLAALGIVTFGIAAPATGQEAVDTLRPAQRIAPLVLIGDEAEDRLRLRQLRGEASTDGFLLRSPSSLTHAPLGADDVLDWSVIPPRASLVWNSDLPFSPNQDGLWAGRGANAQVIAGVQLVRGPLRLILAPAIEYSQNREFQVIAADSVGRSQFTLPWRSGVHSADLPVRFGDRPLHVLHLGQSSLTYRAGGIAGGLASESQWWGPGIRNAIVMSNNAPGIPHAFARTDAPLRTAAGSLEARWMLGGLAESLFFDADPANDLRSLSGVAVSFRPTIEPNLTLGISRTVVGTVSGAGGLPARALDALLHWERPAVPAPPDTVGPDSVVAREIARATQRQGARREQILSLFARWILPADGFEVYAEWSRMEIPSSLRDLLTEPQHSQGYTLGTQWARPLWRSHHLRLQGEATYLEESATFDNRPVPSYYTSPTVVQGYTHRGRVVGAAIGPGASSQWLAADYMAPRWRLGLFGGRVRWDNDAYYTDLIRLEVAHDVSVFGGARAGVELLGTAVTAQFTRGIRYNYLFQNPTPGPRGEFATDIRNSTFELSVQSFGLR